MPPRISTSRLSTPSSSSSQPCFRTRPLPRSDASQCRRPFSVSHQRAGRNRKIATKLRRDMWSWLSGPGRVFVKPAAASTNYLSAYDRQGKLIRQRYADQNKNTSQDEQSEEDARQQEDEERVDEEKRDMRVVERARKRQETEARDGVPPERLSDLRPFPLNKDFASQPVLSEELRVQIYEQVVENKHDLETVAGTFGVDIRRVAAVVRLKTVEKRWQTEGKQLAKPYAEAVLSMLPKTPFHPNASRIIPHEPINDVLVHAKTRQQIFYPTSESRQFTRADAARVFHENLLPADDRIPLPSLVKMERWTQQGLDRAERIKMIQEDDKAQREKKLEVERRKAAWEARKVKIVEGRRWDFRFQDVSVTAAKTGRDGKGRFAVGHRYGFPLEDRKKGAFKLPKSVE